MTRGESVASHISGRGGLSVSDVSDDSSWDSELDGPDSDDDADADDDATRIYRFYPEAVDKKDEEDEEDEFERDPWNAVCVVGLRVFSKDTDVSIEVVKPVEGKGKERTLDVDDSAADATKAYEQKKAFEEAALAIVGSAPANEEVSRQG